MSYKLKFDAKALKEWEALDHGIRSRCLKILARRLEHPHVISDSLSGELAGCYKVRLGKSGHRLVYLINESDQTLFILSIGKRADKAAYRAAILRILDSE
ncbi:MAG: type II toxin-antitoxin system RelE/ParE family toxin [Candidatus Nanopelagicales bacterium]|nr:type II toxin-antitoxin system RelE/ParE family toxin [Candidatus Nanopelagicales bacterium]